MTILKETPPTTPRPPPPPLAHHQQQQHIPAIIKTRASHEHVSVNQNDFLGIMDIYILQFKLSFRN